MKLLLEWKLCIETPSLVYAAKPHSWQPIFAADIPYPLLKLWQEYMVIYNFKKQTTKEGTAEDCCQGNNLPQFDYADLFELSIPGNVFAITDGTKIRDEVNESLRKIAGKVKLAYSKAKEVETEWNYIQSPEDTIFLKEWQFLSRI